MNSEMNNSDNIEITDNETQNENKSKSAVYRAKRKYYLKNKEKYDEIKKEWLMNAYNTRPEFKQKYLNRCKNYYQEHREEILEKKRLKRQLTALQSL